MKMMCRIAFHAAAVVGLCIPCRAAFALEADDPVARPERATPTMPPAQSADPKRDDVAPDHSKESKRRVDHVRLGVLGSVAFPRPLAIEGMVKLENTFGLGVEYSALPQLSIDGVQTHFWAVAADARYFPFHDAFFVGLRAGRQHLGGDGNVTITGLGSLNEAVSVDTTFVNPRIGFLWTWDPGVSLGINLGVQLPLSVSSASSLPSAVTVASDVTRVTNSLGRYALPTIDLLQIGVLL